MHAANSTNLEFGSPTLALTSTSPGSSVSRTNIKLQQENMLYSPKAHLNLDALERPRSPRRMDPDLIVNEQNPIQIGGESQPITSLHGQLIKPFISDELAALIRGYESSSISRSVRAVISECLASSYPNASANDLESLRLRSRRTQNNLLPTVNSQSIMRASSFFNGSQTFIEGFERSGANWVDQFKILSGRTFKNLYRNPDLLRTHYAISIFVAFLCGLLFWKVDDTLAGFQNRLGVMFFVCALFGFGCLSSMQVFASERLIFVRERANRYYSPITYFTSKVLLVI